MTTGFLSLALLLAPGAAAAFADDAASAQDGSAVYIGRQQGYGGTGLFPIYAPAPANPGEPGTPDLWAYCIEHDVSAKTGIEGTVGGLGSYLGANRFNDPAVQSKVLWVLAHSYPALSLEEFGTAAGVPGIARADAIEATQYAIWRYTDLDFDAPWAWETDDSKTAYYHLVNGANASNGMAPAEAATTVSLSAPSAPQEAGTIVGPFVVTTNRPPVKVSVDPAATLTDADGAVLDPNSIVDGQALYLDLRGTKGSGTATITATAAGSAVNGHIVSVPTTPGGTPTAAAHAQSIILVAPGTATTSAEAVARWNGVEEGGATGTATPSAEPSGPTMPAPAPSVSVTTAGTATPSADPSASTSPAPAPSASTTTSGTAAPSADPSASASPAPGDWLAKTGSSGTGVIAGIAAALAVVGGGILFTVRRRRSARH
ncbi:MULTISPECIES: Cys-Gln thioester bond-forming surface protein [unclassified Streptomyces]|uniref:Cys-Gln thioester bond-forming surface protein n=1 Tax=unclassified Streptomyces TaxID=2593676 RepID=UPI0016610C34|nr:MULTISPECIES: Cys-Gln thioester bond-forming surface protein [unclassified Streptomyces]MBD0709568.1 hypothetical protein [Streptomyces sp. CBMA291]MBD0715269.1 hypothetical protein [Streptomyces sp. CBMA370]MBD0717889.1 hypothetical protein [Streptomyces sp. CBMA370]